MKYSITILLQTVETTDDEAHFRDAVIKAMGKIHTNKEVWIYVSSIKIIKNTEIALIMPVMQS